MWPFSSKKPDPKLEALRAEYDALVPRMVEDRIERIEGFDVLICVRPVLINTQGRLALKVAHNSYGSWAIHEINKDGTFSKKGPYWIRPTRSDWHTPDQYVEVMLLMAREGECFKRETQSNGVHRIGYKVLEFNTVKRPIIEWKNYKWSRGH
jgi:hypothetical protein